MELVTTINPPERQRVYHFPNGQKVYIANVCELIVRPSGSHRLKTTEGKHYVVSPGWLCIELDIDHWTV